MTDPAAPKPLEPPDEFAGIPSRRSRHPVLAAAVVAMAFFLAIKMRHDIVYALSSTTAIDLGDARALTARPLADLPVNRYVRLAGPADRESAVVLDTQGSWKFSQFLRLLVGDGRFFVRRASDPLPADLAEHDVFVGRLVPVADLSFYESIRQHFASHVTATHFLRTADLAAAIERRKPGAAASLKDTAGSRIELHADDDIEIGVASPGEIRVEVPRQRFPDLSLVRGVVAEHGGEVVSAVEASGSGVTHSLVVRFPADRRDRAMSVLGDLDRRVKLRPARSIHRAKFEQLTMTTSALTINGSPPETWPLAEVALVRTAAPVQIPGDAVLVVEGDRPGDHLWAVVMVAVLLAFAIVNLLALRRAV